MSEQRIPAEQMEPLARQLAWNWIHEWVMGDRWMGYPDGEKQEQEAMEDYLPTAREDARRYLSLAGIEVEGESDE